MEKDIEEFVKNHFNELFAELNFIKNQFSIGDYIIDILAYAPQTKSFVIIEIKKGKDSSLSDQGVSYLNSIINRKADVVLEYNQKLGFNMKINDFDWTESKLKFISQEFNRYQIDATASPALPIELYKITRYDDNLIEFKKVEKYGSSKSENIIKVSKSLDATIKSYTEEDLINHHNSNVQELYKEYKKHILDLAIDLKEPIATKTYMAFKKNGYNFCDIVIQKKSIDIFINLKKGELNDATNRTSDVSNKGKAGNGDYVIKGITNINNLEYDIALIKQSLLKK
ncbi:MAG: hypothetical protein QM529_01180 [Hydrotalea sp.]|nr:hypothetical protein [Hydrotalea sp.]